MTEPDTSDLFQDEDVPGGHELTSVVIPVRVVGVEEPLRIQQVPSRTSTGRMIQVLTIEEILSDDPRRKRVLLLAAVQGCYLGSDRTTVANGIGFALPVNVPIVLENQDAMWARTADPAQLAACALSIWVESWAD
jgi:hypothetical protein